MDDQVEQEPVPTPDPVPITRWEFDHYSPAHWQEIKAGKVDKTQSWIELSEVPDEWEQRLTVFLNREEALTVTASRDQWGTWISFVAKCTVAQEDETKSFIDALIASLVRLRAFTDFKTKPPVLTELHDPGPQLKFLIEETQQVIKSLQEDLWKLKKKCKHEFVKDIGTCVICKQNFGWYCEESPDKVCHYLNANETTVKLLDGTEVVPPFIKSSWDACVFCRNPSERK